MDENIVKLIQKDIEEKENKYIARRYYKYKPAVESGIINFVDEFGKTRSLNLAQSSKLYTNYFKLLVNQKINYLLSKEPTLEKNIKFSIVKITDLLEDLLLNASLDTTSWIQFYIDDNSLDWLIIPDKEIIPFYDKYNKKLEEIIKYFLIDKDTFLVEHWTLSGVTTYKIHKNRISDVMQKSHFEVKTYYNDGEIEKETQDNFKSIPFIPLYNNKAKETDLEGIQELLDMYNSINSGFIENINIFQEFLIKLQGFSGDDESLRQVLHNMKKFKAMSLPEGSDADYMKVDIPVEARKTILDILKENIFMIGQGMDPTKIGDGNLTNIVIQSRYAALDMKANRTEKQIKLFYEKFISFINGFYNITNDDTIICNRSMLFNITEAIKNCNDSKGTISNETIIDNHPFVSNTKEELKRIEEEKKKVIEEKKEMFNNNQNNTNDDDNNNNNDDGDNNKG